MTVLILYLFIYFLQNTLGSLVISTLPTKNSLPEQAQLGGEVGGWVVEWGGGDRPSLASKPFKKQRRHLSELFMWY